MSIRVKYAFLIIGYVTFHLIGWEKLDIFREILFELNDFAL